MKAKRMIEYLQQLDPETNITCMYSRYNGGETDVDPDDEVSLVITSATAAWVREKTYLEPQHILVPSGLMWWMHGNYSPDELLILD